MAVAIEQTIDGGTFGASTPKVPAVSVELTAHGGYFGGVEVPARRARSSRAMGDFELVLEEALAEFGVAAEYQPSGGSPYLLRHGVIFRASHQEVDVTTGATVTSTQPHATAMRYEVPTDWTDRDLVIVLERVFRVRDVQPDGEVGAKLMLHEVLA